MKVRRITRAICVVWAVGMALPAWSQNPVSAIAIQDLVTEAQAVLAEVQKQIASQQLPPLRQIKLSLQTVNIPAEPPNSWVVPAGATLAKNQTGQIDLLLRVPASSPTASAPPLSQDLENAILGLAVAVKQSMNGKKSSQITSQDVKLDLAASLNGSQVQITPVAAGTSAVHHVTLTFASQ